MGVSRVAFLNGVARREATVSLIGIVDDDAAVRDAVSSLLRSAGYRCAAFSSAEAFLDSGRLSETQCMVLDVSMPGLSGHELQRKLREMKCSIPIVFITGQGDDEVRARTLREGAAAFLAKPFSDVALLSAIRSALRYSRN